MLNFVTFDDVVGAMKFITKLIDENRVLGISAAMLMVFLPLVVLLTNVLLGLGVILAMLDVLILGILYGRATKGKDSE